MEGITDYYARILQWCSEILDMVGKQNKSIAGNTDDTYILKLEIIDIKRRLDDIEAE